MCSSDLDVYANVAASFQRHPGVLEAGGHSMFESLGGRHPRLDGLIRVVAGGLTVVVTLGFVSLPCAILFKLAGG